MKIGLLLIAAAIPALAQQKFDFKSLDKLGANATESTNIGLEGDTLKLATSLLGDDKSPFRSLTGVYVRSFEYAKTGQYKDADLEPVRAYIRSLQWNKIVDVKESGEKTEIYLQALPNNRLGGLAIVSAEAKEVTVVFISGNMDIADLGKLSGNLGLPDMTVLHGGSKADSQKKD
jgi:hypothetical protein